VGDVNLLKMTKIWNISNFQGSQLDLTNSNLSYLGRYWIVDCVPEVIIPENCRLDNKIYMGYDFPPHRATTIYSGTAH